MKPPPDSFHPTSRRVWRAWLAANHRREAGIWLIFFKKATGEPRVEYGEAVEEALAFGWIDSKPRALDARRSMLWFAPRKKGSGWSRANQERVERLLQAGLMEPAGLEKVEAAKRDGSWSSLDAVEALEVPPDLAAALGAKPSAARHFEAFPRSTKKGILEWIQGAKKPETRAKRVAETARLAARNVRANQWRPAGGGTRPKAPSRPRRRSAS